MAYLVRKLIKRGKLSDLINEDDLKAISADIPTTEFRTTNGALSTWKIDNLDDIDDAVLAIAVTSSEISKLDCIIIDTELLPKNNLKYEKTYAGRDIPVPDLQETHCDIVGISFAGLEDCAKLYRDILKEDSEKCEHVIRFSEGKIRGIIQKALNDERIDIKNATGKIYEELFKMKNAI